ncbi:MAG: hypothetical protein KY450_11135 [Actinobacteria bacterium]|nr:hypothetical protein [Actinomycetota bacterium]
MAGELATHAVWQNELGGLTFEVGSGEERFFVKWAPKASGVDLAPEAARLRWAIAFTPVAQVLDEGADESGSWLVLTPLPIWCRPRDAGSEFQAL